MRLSGLPLAVAAASLTSAQHIVSNPHSACASILHSFSYPNVTLYFSEYISAGTNLSLPTDNGLASCGTPNQVVPVDVCRVALLITTSATSNVSVEAWLPTNWTGRYASTGNGGLAGCIQYIDVAYGVSFGFATIGTNNGHNGTSGAPFYQNSEVVADFAYRALHVGTEVGKALTKAYYGRDYTKSYYFGCSTGGREGFKSIQDFPDDFDGLLLGAPALNFNNLSSWSGHFLQITGLSDSPNFITAAQWTNLIHPDILAQCDGLDGVVDGIIEDPDLCYYRPINLQCKPGSTTNCLTSAQVQIVEQIFQPYYGLNGSLIFPRVQPGSELSDAYIYYSGVPFPYTVDWYRYAILEDPNWQATELNATYAAIAATTNPFNIETWNGDLSAFQRRGGKVLHYHGQADSIITSENSPRYYDHVVTTMGLPPSSLDEFYRFFRISGMDHCAGGVGAWQIGQTLPGAQNTTLDPQHNVLLRIVDWVEKGNAPDTVTGTKFVNDTASLGVDFVRNHCRYPYRNQCVDPKNYRKPEAWKCVI